MIINKDIKELADYFYSSTSENNEVYFIKWTFPNNELLDLSYEKAVKDNILADETLEKINNFRNVNLTHTDEIILSVLEYYCYYIKKNLSNYWYKFDLNHYTCPISTLLEKLNTLKTDTIDDMNKYLSIFCKFPKFISDMKIKLETQSSKYIRMPVESCNMALKTLHTFIDMTEETYRGPETKKYVEATKKAIEEIISYIENEYIQYAPQTIGMSQYPGGYEMYMRQVNTYISCDELPEKIQGKGYKALENTRAKMKGIIEKLGYNCTIEQFNEIIQGNDKFKFKTPEEMQNTMTQYLDKIRPLMSTYFNRMPKADCAVKRLNPILEASTSWGHYNIPVENPLGVYYYSAVELDKRCNIRTAAVVYHELFPGHHYQMNLVLEDESLPLIIRNHYNTACADGWAEYASGFCEEIGLYDLYSEYGRLTWDAFLCCRLIVDTGLNALGWTYDKAEKFLSSNTMFTKAEIYTELLRYTTAMPAQALSYKWGSLKFLELRDKAKEILKDKFDLKEFHDVMIEFGSIPLDILEQHFNWYIKTKFNT